MSDNSYTQYNTNVQAVATAHVAQYMGWYEGAVILYVLAAVVFVVYWFFQSRLVLGCALALSVAGLIAQVTSLWLRALYSHHVPWNDLYGSLSVVALWSVLLFLIFSWRFKLWFAGPLVLVFADAMLAYARGWNKGLSPMPASLQDNYWIFIHVPVVLAAYAGFLVGFATSILFLLKKWDEGRVARIAGGSVGAAVATRHDALGRPAWLSWLDRVPPSTRLDVVSYRIIAVGEILLTAGIILGGVWAHQAWGSYWQWDPKETAALASWMIYAAYLHLHTRPSWRGSKAAWVSIVGFASILFCYFAVNILIGGPNVLHSYK
jgi:cytochrome c-type biogenesis protein CcsB